MADETEPRQDEQAAEGGAERWKKRVTAQPQFSAPDGEQTPQYRLPAAALLFQAPDLSSVASRSERETPAPKAAEETSDAQEATDDDGRRRRRGGRGRRKTSETAEPAESAEAAPAAETPDVAPPAEEIGRAHV